jgi:hypothetical protein
MSTADSEFFNGGGVMPALPAVPNHKDKESEEEALSAAAPNNKDKESEEEEDNNDDDCTPSLSTLLSMRQMQMMKYSRGSLRVLMSWTRRNYAT